MRDAVQSLVVLTPAFPAEESETHWVPSQQLLVRCLLERFPATAITVIAFLLPSRVGIYDWHGATVYSFHGMGKRRLSHLMLWARVWRRLKMLRREKQLDGIFSFWCGECALVGKYFGKRFGVPHYTWICGQDARPGNPLLRYIRPSAESLVSMSVFLTEEFYRNYGIRPVSLIPNGVCPKRFPMQRSRPRTIDILGVGSLERQKQYEVFVTVVHALYGKLPHLKALHFGDGPERAALECIVEGLEMSHVLRFAGARSHEIILGHMCHARILLHPSAYEGYSTVCLEALCAGAHVISFCHPGGGEIPRWHQVGNADEMFRCALALLEGKMKHDPVVVHTMEESADAVMRLFDPQPSTGKRAEGW